MEAGLIAQHNFFFTGTKKEENTMIYADYLDYWMENYFENVNAKDTAKMYKESFRTFITAFLTACYTGMRTGEVFALTWDDIDFKNNVINIDKNVFAIDKSKNGRWYIGTTKTRGSTRKIYMCNTLKEILINFKKYQTSCKKKYKSDYKRYYFESVKNNLGIVRYFKIIELKNKSKNKKEVNLIFRKDNGFYAGKDIIKYPFKIIHNELGIKCRFYDLRGSFATVCLRNGCEIKDIAGVLGHKRIETTENYYVSSTDNDKMNVSKSFENSLKNLNIII